MKRVILTSDWHSLCPRVRLKRGQHEPYDLMIIAGDIFPGRSFETQYVYFTKMLIPYFRSTLKRVEQIVLIAGNHDFLWSDQYRREACITLLYENFGDKVTYLEDSGTTLWKDSPYQTKIWGTPWTLGGRTIGQWTFQVDNEIDFHRKCTAHIPTDIDILVSHGPMCGVLDKAWSGEHLGSHMLKQWVMEHKPRLVVHGHIHENGGFQSIRVGEGPDDFVDVFNVTLMGDNMVSRGHYYEVGIEASGHISFLGNAGGC